MQNARRTRTNSKSIGLIGGVLRDIVRLIIFGFLGAIFFLVRYVLRTPQPLKSVLPGEERLFRWTHGHIFYKVLGAQNAPPLVLIHTPEIAASSYEMRDIMEPLARRFRVYALDLPGFGLSDHPHIAYTGEMYVAFLRDFLAQVVSHPATLVANGLSANYAITLASAAPEQCERLVLLSPTALFTDGKVRHWYTPLLENPFIGLCVYAFLTTRIVLHAVLTRGQGVNALSDAELDHYYAAAHQFGSEHPVIAYMTGNLSLDISCQLETLQKLRQPLLVIWGLHAMQRALHSVRINALQEGASAPLLALTDTSNTSSTLHSVDITQRVVLLEDANRHVQETQATQVASYILAETSDAVETKQNVPSFQVAEFVADEYTNKEEISVKASSFQDAEVAVEVPSDVDVLEDIEREEEAQGVQSVQQPEIVETSQPQQQEQIEAYCVKCKQKRIMENPTDTTTKKGRSAKEGSCPVCGTHLFRFIASEKE